MFKSFFSSLYVALAVLIAGASLPSCNKDEVIEQLMPPEIVFDNETGIYKVKVGEEILVAPDYRNVDEVDAAFAWSIGDEVIADTPALKYVWNESGKYYVTVSVVASGGKTSEELLIEVFDPAPPVISLPVASDEITIAVGTEYVLTPEINNADIDGFKIMWSVNGENVGDGSSYVFEATETGTYILTVSAENIDGADSMTLRIIVVDKLSYDLVFPTPTYFINSTDRFTFPGRPVYLSPVIGSVTPAVWRWSVNGISVDCTESTYVFTPDEAGEYIVNVIADNSVTASVKVVCVDADEDTRYRAATASSLPESNKVYEWVPAPGQFIGETITGGMTGNETTQELAVEWAEKRLSQHYYVSLGGFGGYIVVGFDHSISKTDGNYDFAVMANAFLNAASGAGGSNEPGIVYVMQDINGNGLPDDEWYELRGSETGKAGTRQNYAVTYYRPAGPAMAVQWTDNFGVSGSIDYLSAFHRQDYYYPAWIDADSYTLRGTCLKDRTTQDPKTGFWDNSAFEWGYVDNIGGDNMVGGNSITGDGQRNGFLIENAMYSDCSHINLKYIDFIKVQTGVNTKAGWLGEVSTEVFGFTDLNIAE